MKRPDGVPAMNNRELEELKVQLTKATDREIGFIYVQMGEKDPFLLPENRLVLPSVIREKAYKHIEALFRNGLLTARKNG
jgi:hypothetical protein